MIASSRSYAIGMVHFQLGGGWRGLLMVLIAYLVLFLGGAALFYYEALIQPNFVREAGTAVLVLLMGLQGMALLLVGGYRVSSAVRRDISTHMLESHRLMPISSPNAIFGYIFGPTTAVTCFALLNLALSLVFGMYVGASIERMAINQAVIFAFAVFVWAMTVMGTFIYRHIFFVALAVMFFGTCTQLVVVAYAGLPGFAMLMTPFVGETIFAFGMGAPEHNTVYALGIAGQALFFVIFFLGSCRLYRGTHPTAFSVPLGMAFLAAWAGLSALGIRFSDELTLARIIRGFGGKGGGLLIVQVVMSLTLCVIFGAVPFWALLHEERAGRPRPWLWHVLTVLLAAVLMSVPIWGASSVPATGERSAVITLLCLAGQALTLYCLIRFVRSLRPMLALLIAALSLIFLWVGPLVLELLRVLMVERGGGSVQEMSALSTASPGALLGQLWSNEPGWFIPGLLWQWFVAGVLLMVVVLTANRSRKQTQRGEPPVLSVAPAIRPAAAIAALTAPPPLPVSSSPAARPEEP